MNDYRRTYFLTVKDKETGISKYYFRINGTLHEVSHEVYRVCMNDYRSDLAEYHKRQEEPLASFDYIDPDDGRSLYEFYPSTYNTEKDAINHILLDMVRKEIDKLDPVNRKILLLYFFYGVRVVEIAEIVGFTEHNVYARIHKCIDILKNIFAEKKK